MVKVNSVTRVVADVSASISDFKANPNSVIEKSKGEAVAILKSNQTFFYAVPPALYEIMFDAMEDLALLQQAQSRMNDGEEPIEININEL